MILLIGVVLGLVAGWVRAKTNKRKLQVVSFKWELLVILGFLPQAALFYLPNTSQYFSDKQAAILLVISQFVLIVFATMNFKKPGFSFLGLGLLLNFIVIVANGGYMPISPEMVSNLYPDLSDAWQVGNRLGLGKDIVLNINETNFWWLSDRFLISKLLKRTIAYSIGDVLIFIGSFLFLWSLGANEKSHDKQKIDLGELYNESK